MPLRFTPNRGAGALSLNAMVRGPQGAAATIAVGTTTTGAAGASASVTNSGTSSAATFNFTVPRGADAGFKYTFDSSTDTTTTPSSGGVRFNNATPAGITEIAIHATDADGNPARPTWLTVDDSTNTARGTIAWKRYDGVQIVLNINGTFTDNTTWLKLAVTHSSGTTLFTAADKIFATWHPTGNKGADGVIAGSSGSTDNAILRADGVGGATLQSSLVSIDDSGNITPQTTDVGGLGTSALNWSDLFLDSGGVINWDSGDVTATHSANALAFAGASSGYSFDAKIIPATNDGAPLGDATHQFSDLYLAEGGVINWDNGDATLTQVNNVVTLTGATLALDAGATVGGSLVATVGKQTISIPASAMWARTTNGPAAASRELTTSGDVMIKGWAFDTTTEEAVQFYIPFPKSWDKSTITFKAWWTNASGLTTETVSWGLSAGAFTDDDPIDTTELGTEVRVSDTWLAQNDMHVTAESAAVTVGNTPIDGDLVIGQIARSVANDNMTGDADLLAIHIYYTTNAATDA